MKIKDISWLFIGVLTVLVVHKVPVFAAVTSITLQSSAFLSGQEIPKMYTCDGENISPPLNWHGVTKISKEQFTIVPYLC